jgi:hypothetical protein
MIQLGFRVLSLLIEHHPAATSTSLPQLDFSISANTGYRGFFF